MAVVDLARLGVWKDPVRPAPDCIPMPRDEVKRQMEREGFVFGDPVEPYMVRVALPSEWFMFVEWDMGTHVQACLVAPSGQPRYRVRWRLGASPAHFSTVADDGAPRTLDLKCVDIAGGRATLKRGLPASPSPWRLTGTR